MWPDNHRAQYVQAESQPACAYQPHPQQIAAHIQMARDPGIVMEPLKPVPHTSCPERKRRSERDKHERDDYAGQAIPPALLQGAPTSEAVRLRQPAQYGAGTRAHRNSARSTASAIAL